MNRRLLPAALLCAGLVSAPGAVAQDKSARSETFQTYCQVCHGEDGKGKTEEGLKKGARDFTQKKFQDAVDDGRIQKSITKGHDKMPAFGKRLSEDEIKALVKEVREIGGKKAS